MKMEIMPGPNRMIKSFVEVLIKSLMEMCIRDRATRCAIIQEEGFAMLLGSMEAGGTKMVLCIGDEEQHIFERETISTTCLLYTSNHPLDGKRANSVSFWLEIL